MTRMNSPDAEPLEMRTSLLQVLMPTFTDPFDVDSLVSLRTVALPRTPLDDAPLSREIDEPLPLTNDAVAQAYDVLKSDAVTALGLDAEWRPDRGHGATQSKCSVLQVACATHAFLFDLINTSMGDLEDLFTHLFTSERIVKLGFGLDGDIKRLRWSFPESKCFDVFKSVVDLSFETPHPLACLDGMYSILGDNDTGAVLAPRQPRRTKGLSAVVKETLGLPLRKTQQRSDWERRPLTPAQISYAALDAFCLLMLHDALQQETSSQDTPTQ